MNDPESVLTEVYVLVDDLLPEVMPVVPVRPGPPPALAPSEIITLAVMSQWARFRSERDFYRYAEHQLRPLFPHLPSRSQFNRHVRRWAGVIAHLGAVLGHHLAAAPPYEIIDTTAVPLRNVKRGGARWLGQEVDIGWSSRLGWYEGVHLLTCASPTGVLTGMGAGPASVNDRRLAETFFALRTQPAPGVPSVGTDRGRIYLADQGFGGQAVEQRWQERYGVTLICPPQVDRRTRRWPPALHAWLKPRRQIIETVHGRLLRWFRLEATRPHTLTGALAMLAATFAMHNITIWLNRHHGRPDLSIAEVLGW